MSEQAYMLAFGKISMPEYQVYLQGKLVGLVKMRQYSEYPDLDNLWRTTMNRELPMKIVKDVGTLEAMETFDIPLASSHEFFPERDVIRFTFTAYDLDIEQYESIFDFDVFVPA